MIYISEEQKKHIVDVLRDNKGDVTKTAKDLGFTPNQVRWADTTYNKRFDYSKPGFGRPELQGSIVAIKNKKEGLWDVKDPAIIRARRLYDEGKVELCTGRDGDNFILYAILRRFIDKRRMPYFPENQKWTDIDGNEVQVDDEEEEKEASNG